MHGMQLIATRQCEYGGVSPETFLSLHYRWCLPAFDLCKTSNNVCPLSSAAFRLAALDQKLTELNSTRTQLSNTSMSVSIFSATAGNMQNWVKLRYVVSEICEQTNRRIHRQTDMHITILLIIICTKHYESAIGLMYSTSSVELFTKGLTKIELIHIHCIPLSMAVKQRHPGNRKYTMEPMYVCVINYWFIVFGGVWLRLKQKLEKCMAKPSV